MAVCAATFWKRCCGHAKLSLLALFAIALPGGALKFGDEPATPSNGALDAKPRLSAFTPEEYQTFIDTHPTSRFNKQKKFSLLTAEGGRHKIEARTSSRLPALIDRFDWALVGGEGQQGLEHKRVSDPKTVWANANKHTLGALLRAVEGQIDDKRSDRVLVFGDSDAWLSDVFAEIGPNPFDATPAGPKNGSAASVDLDPRGAEAYARKRTEVRPQIDAVVARLRRYFGRIFYEAKDLQVAGVGTMPIGMTEFFLRGGVAETAAAAISSASIHKKPGSVKGAFSFYHDLTHCIRGWGEAQLLRVQAREWSKSDAAKAVGVDSRFAEPLDWWSEVARYKFLLAPNGCGVQTPKEMEALWVLTVPITRRGPYAAFDDLVQYGFPMAVVDEWDDITPARLLEWWAKLSPRLEGFRANCLTTDGYWRLFTGELEHCE